MDFVMQTVVTILAVFVFANVSAEELVLQLNGELGSFPESMILSKIQMGVIDPTPIVNERGLRYFVQIARSNVVVYPHGIQTIVPIGRKRYISQRLFQPRTTLSPSALSQRSNIRNTWSRVPNTVDSVQALDPDRRMQTSSSDRNTQTGSLKSVKPVLNQSRQSATDVPSGLASIYSRDQHNRRKIMDVLKPGTQREVNTLARSSHMPERMRLLSAEQAPSIVEAREVARSIVSAQMSDQRQRHLQRQQTELRPSQSNAQHLEPQSPLQHESSGSHDQPPDFQGAQQQQTVEALNTSSTTTTVVPTTEEVTTASTTSKAETIPTAPDSQNNYQYSD